MQTLKKQLCFLSLCLLFLLGLNVLSGCVRIEPRSLIERDPDVGENCRAILTSQPQKVFFSSASSPYKYTANTAKTVSSLQELLRTVALHLNERIDYDAMSLSERENLFANASYLGSIHLYVSDEKGITMAFYPSIVCITAYFENGSERVYFRSDTDLFEFVMEAETIFRAERKS